MTLYQRTVERIGRYQKHSINHGKRNVKILWQIRDHFFHAAAQNRKSLMSFDFPIRDSKAWPSASFTNVGSKQDSCQTILLLLMFLLKPAYLALCFDHHI
jgi:hypothetical protein